MARLSPFLRRLALLALVSTAAPAAAATTGETKQPEPTVQPRPAPGPRVTLQGAPTAGRRTAPLALVVYTDYQCPYCARFHHGLLAELKTRYIDTGVLLFVHKDFPLSSHAQALPASIVARCAGKQGQYGPMQGRLYEVQANLGEPLYRQLATAMGLDLEAFDRCRADPAVRQLVERDVAEGERLGVAATPTLMLGRVVGDGVIVERVGAGLPELEAVLTEIERLRRAPVR